MKTPTAPARKPILKVLGMPITITASMSRPKPSVPSGYFADGREIQRHRPHIGPFGMINILPMNPNRKSSSSNTTPAVKSRFSPKKATTCAQHVAEGRDGALTGLVAR